MVDLSLRNMRENALQSCETLTVCRRMTLSFGYLNKIGYKGYVFPIVIGEAGSRYTDVSASRCAYLCAFYAMHHLRQPT